MKKLALLFALLCAVSVKAQTVSPFGGVATVQVFDNTGTFDPNAVIYFYQAGTTTQQATFTDSSGLTQNPNPMPIGTRATIWLTTSAFYHVVWCLQNDGPFCSADDVLASIDNLPGGASGGGGTASCGSGCAPTTAPAGFDLLCGDVTAHRFKIVGNGGTMNQAVVSGNDISTTDGIIAVHWGATQETLSSTAPSTNQYLRFDGSNISAGLTIYQADQTGLSANVSATTVVTPSANGFYRMSCWLVVTRAATTSSTLPSCNAVFTDADSGVAQNYAITNANGSNTVGASSLSNQVGSFFAKSGVAIQYATSGYASSGVTSMQYAIHVRLEGPLP